MVRKFPVAVVVVGLAAGPAAAQFGAGPPRGPALPPAFSPYLNLARPGASPAINYFGLVRPQLQTDAAVQRLQNQATQVNPFAAAGAAGEQPVVTGNPFGFQNYRSYFQNQFTAGGFGNQFGGAGRGGGGGGSAGLAGQPNPFAQMQPGSRPAGRKR
ncbi:MAG: hypothetical protein K2X82_25990 [Gemmataceae bacterium]|nr:hypothetical protein [Gemmataceae bacterium]